MYTLKGQIIKIMENIWLQGKKILNFLQYLIPQNEGDSY